MAREKNIVINGGRNSFQMIGMCVQPINRYLHAGTLLQSNEFDFL